jgi:cytidine deaminase
MTLKEHNIPLTQDEIAKLTAAATAVAANAYAAYSKFRVGAAVLLADGSVFAGCNVENASYRLTTCAEQAAVARAVSERGPGIRLRAVVIVNLNGTACEPCGACRQTLFEFGGTEAQVLFPGKGGQKQTTLGNLLPHGFHLAHE